MLDTSGLFVDCKLELLFGEVPKQGLQLLGWGIPMPLQVWTKRYDEKVWQAGGSADEKAMVLRFFN